MTSANGYQPRAEDKFSFGLWTVGNPGRGAFGDAARPKISPIEIVSLLAEVGAWGVTLHDNDLVPIDATAAERDSIVRRFKQACESHGIVVPMATVSLFFHPVFRDGAFTANDPEVRAYAVQKTLRAMGIGAELGAKIFVLWGGREGVETDACRRADEGHQATARSGQLSLRIQHRAWIWHEVRFGRQAKWERTRPCFAALTRHPAHVDEKDLIVFTPSRLLPELVNELPGNVNDAGQLVPVFVRECQENF